jgi:butyryl-CoA dehydrogenase
MDFGLDEDQALIVQTVRRFAERDLASWAADADRAGAPPARLTEAGGEVGFFLDAVPSDAGGFLDGDYSHVARALRGFELARGCPALAALLETNVEPALAAARWGSAEAKAALFAALAGGALATTGRDVRGTLAIDRDGDGVHISGRVGPLPALAVARYLLLAARADGEALLVLVDADAARREPMTPSGWRAAQWAALTLDHARVPAAFVLARGAAADAAIASVLAWYRTSLAARAAGTAAIAMAHAARYGAERVQFGQPIGTFESLIRLRDDAETGAAAARLLALHAAWQLDRGDRAAPDTASRARVLAGDVVARATIDAVQIFGGYGFVNDYPVEKLMRDARAFEALLGDERLERALAIKASLTDGGR